MHTGAAKACAISIVSTKSDRSTRVATLLIGIFLLSLGDLYMTLTHANTIGMVEVNPIARRIMASGSTAGVIAWKFGSLLPGIAILYLLRRTRSGELGAWIACIILTWLTLHWVDYNANASILTPHLDDMQTYDKRWVNLSAPPKPIAVVDPAKVDPRK